MPLFPRLRPYLEEAFELAEPGSEFVISDRRTSNVNLRTQFQRILRRAMIEPWPRLFHNLRASFQPTFANSSGTRGGDLVRQLTSDG